MNIHKIIIPTPYPIGDVNAFLVKGDQLSLFDVGPKTEVALDALNKGINEAGYKLEDIEQVVLTHHHPDHAGWVDAFPKADILGHEYNDHFLRREPEFMSYRTNFYRNQLSLQAVPEKYLEKIVESKEALKLYGSTPLTKFIGDGDVVPGHPGLRAIYTPGHAQSHLIFLDESTNEVIGGDLLLDKVAANPLVEPPTDLSNRRPKALIQQQESLKLLRELNVSKVYAGHGEEIVEVNDLIDKRLEKDQLRLKQLIKHVVNTPKTVIELTMDLYPAHYRAELGLTLSKTLGYLDCLVRDGLVSEEIVNDVIVYTRN
ncbi:MBL fold metallo-hydrolase [Ureibacillus chungkukjangi]|uniref:Glyoxylase-like metal-dependent hydrolase (Beta-lactamase superfamily II) n=1 Tax=Ureibacillus chungkukjangi TaxID=1202712 RepID=A0A318TTH2_9BACL|nr:MBL fold metallo-hydrolase [Ureibacillus chungkukjangi]PYF07227.1 glyoxylase-like metal-dependent hydrolase (beta-lactamase superfamily II) [Ureibacillus chungkukjangi]